eukprot:COSAG05_NODE_8169_length_729_cov_1.236508_1_plen_145_part_10
MQPLVGAAAALLLGAALAAAYPRRGGCPGWRTLVSCRWTVLLCCWTVLLLAASLTLALAVLGGPNISRAKLPVCWVTQSGSDGLGHQLHGVITAMALHGLNHPAAAGVGATSIHLSRLQFAAPERQFLFDRDHMGVADPEWRECE